MSMPCRRRNIDAQAPAESTTACVRMRPRSVKTPLMRPPVVSSPRTAVPLVQRDTARARRLRQRRRGHGGSPRPSRGGDHAPIQSCSFARLRAFASSRRSCARPSDRAAPCRAGLPVRELLRVLGDIDQAVAAEAHVGADLVRQRCPTDAGCASSAGFRARRDSWCGTSPSYGWIARPRPRPSRATRRNAPPWPNARRSRRR